MKKLEEQIAGADDSGVKAVGILLREICRMSPQAAELVGQDLENKGMSIQECYGFLFAYAKKHKTKCCWACPVVGIDPGNEVVKVILEFYHIPAEWLATPDADRGTMRAGGEALPAGQIPGGDLGARLAEGTRAEAVALYQNSRAGRGLNESKDKPETGQNPTRAGRHGRQEKDAESQALGRAAESFDLLDLL